MASTGGILVTNKVEVREERPNLVQLPGTFFGGAPSLREAVPGLGLKAERHSLRQKSTSWCCMKKGPSYRTKIPRKPTRYLVSPIHRYRAQLYSIKRCRLRAGRRRLKWALLMTTTTGLDDTTGDLDSPRPSATAKKRS